MLIFKTNKIASLTFNLVISTFILTMLSFGNGKLTIKLIVLCTLSSAVLTIAGELTLRTFRMTKIKAWLPMAFVVGFAAISLPMIALTLIFNMSAFSAFCICALLVLSVSFFTADRTISHPSSEWVDTAVALTCLISIGFLAKIPVSSPSILLHTGILPIWSDYFIHGLTIASFGSPFSSGSDMELAGVSRTFYHYAPFMIPAAFQTLSGMSGFTVATSVLLPFGLLIFSFGSYAFAVELGGRLSGLVALAAIICLPAPSDYLIKSGWFDFSWLLFAAPGTGYALGVSAAVCASMVLYLRENDLRVLSFTLLLLLSLVLIRVHMFMLLAPTILSTILLHRQYSKIRLLFSSAITAIAIVIMTLHFSADLHKLWIEYCKPYEYMTMALEWTPIYKQQIQSILAYAPELTSFFQILIILVAILGPYIFLYPMLSLLNIRYFGFSGTDTLPLLMVVCFVGLMLFATSAGNGDLSEYKHRHFGLLYTITVIYTIATAFALAYRQPLMNNRFRKLLCGLVIIIFPTTIFLNWGSNPAHPNTEAMPWSSEYHNQPISPGLLEAAQYILSHSRKGDILAMAPSFTTSDPRALIVELVSLTGIPAFIARSDLKMMRSQSVQDIVIQRLNLLQGLSLITNWQKVQHTLKANGIRWFVVSSRDKPQWDPNLKFAVFSINGISVYDSSYPIDTVIK